MIIEGGADIWQNVISAARKLVSVLKYPTLIEDLTELGSQTYNVLKRLLTVLLVVLTPAPVAYVLVRLLVLSNSKH